MTFIWSLLQVVLVLGILGLGAYYSMGKIKKNQFTKQGQNGKIVVEDGMTLGNQSTGYLLKVDGQQLFVVIGPNGSETTMLREKRFRELMNESIKEASESVEVSA